MYMMSQFPFSPIPYQMRMSGEMMMKACDDPPVHTYQFVDNKENVSPSSAAKKIMFPSTRAVLWNRNPIGNPTELCVPGNPSDVKLSLNKRTLQLAYKQLHVTGEDFSGFCIGELQIQGDKISIIIDRFDPGRDGQIKTENGFEKIRIPTTFIPGDLNVPILLCNGMAFVDHVTTQTHTEEEFIKTMKVLESWCSRKDALNVNNLFSSKLKCCFQVNEDEILTYITCGLVFIKEQFSLVPINPIAIIPTALARNLEGPIPLSDVQGHVKTGFITMDQTRKLLLLLETDPKAYSLPLVGVWISGIEDIKSAEVWACCTRFIHNSNIEERVYAPPDSYLLLTYLTKTASATFHEFSRKENKSDDVQFEFLSCCEGIAMSKTSECPSNDEEYVFDMVSMSTGALTSIFQRAVDKGGNSGYAQKLPDTNSSDDVPTTLSSLDDSIPLDCPSLSPHPQLQMQIPDFPDLSMCDIETSAVNRDITDMNNGEQKEGDNENSPNRAGNRILQPAVTKTMQVYKRPSNKPPRQTKASLARININKPVKSTIPNKKTQKKANLAISFSNPNERKKEVERCVKQTIPEKSLDLVNIEKIDLTEKTELDKPVIKLPVKMDMMEKTELDKHVIKLPVKIRQSSELKQSTNSSVTISKSKHINESSEMNEHNVDEFPKMTENSQVQPYYAECYSDPCLEESFVLESNEEISAEMATSCNRFEDGNPEQSDCELEETVIKSVTDVEEQPESMDNEGSKNTLVESIDSSVNEKLHDKDGDQVNGSGEEKSDIDKIEDLNKKTKDALYDLVLTQQAQLANLQAQLQLFLKHQNIKQANEKSDNEDKKEVKKSEVSSELSSIQEKQQLQLNSLQLQVQEFLRSSKSPDKKDTSSQCSIGDRTNLVLPPTLNSVAVNTGESLLWPTVNMASTNSDTTPRGYQQAEGIGAKGKGEGKKESFCQHCHRAKKYMMHQKSEETISSNESPCKPQLDSPSLSDIHAEDIASSIFEDTANSSRSVSSSLREIDMPVYEDSQDVCSSPVRQKKSEMDWESSPMLGESASMLVEEERKRRMEERKDDAREEEKDKEEEVIDISPINNPTNKEFYSQVMSQVQKLIEAQNISPTLSNNSKENIPTQDGSQASKDNSIVSSPEECLQRVRDVTVKQLNEMINYSNDSESTTTGPLTDRPRSQSAGVVATLPRINYISMAVDETICEESNFERIAAKYLPDGYLQNQRTEVRNKTVKFEGMYELNTTGRNINMASVNFSCNMSIASKKYLQRYELGESENLAMQPLVEVNGRVLQSHVRHSMDTRSYSESDKENILDFKKLRNLPKLL